MRRKLAIAVLLAGTAACSTQTGARKLDIEGETVSRGAMNGPAVAPTGSRDPGAIRSVIQANRGEVAQCYEKFLADHPDAAGRVVMRIVIDPSGTVSAAEMIETTVPGPEALSGCFTSAFRALKFGAGTGLVTVSYPYTLAP